MFRLGFYYSIALHIIIILVLVLGLPSFWRPAPEEQAISVEIMPVTKDTNVKQRKTNKEAKTTERTKKIKKAAEVPDKDAKAKKDVAKKDAKLDKEIKKEQKPQIEENKKKDVSEKIKKDDKKKIEDKAQKQKQEKQDATKKEDKKNKAKKEEKKKKDEDFDALEKSLEEAETTKKHNKKVSKELTNELDDLLNEPNEKSNSTDYDASKPLGMDVQDSIRNQIEKNWNIPLGIKDINKMRIALRLKIEPDGTIIDAKPASSSVYESGSAGLQSLYDSALRAVFKSSPLQGLPQDSYASYREIELVFDPSYMLQQ